MKRRQLSGVAAAGFVLGIAGRVPSAHAGDEWCMIDPAVPIRTPSGAMVVVHLNCYGLGSEHRPAVARTTFDYVAEASSDGKATAVELSVLIPLGLNGSRFPARSVVSTEPNARNDLGQRKRTQRRHDALTVHPKRGIEKPDVAQGSYRAPTRRQVHLQRGSNGGGQNDDDAR